MTVVGLDTSLTGTGICVVDGDPAVKWQVGTAVLKTKLTGHARLDFILREVGNATRGADLVVMEGPSYMSKGSSVHQIAGLWWMIRHQMWASDISVAIAPPTSLKKYITGKGNAGKDEMIAAAVRRFPSLDFSDNNVADAIGLAAMGCHHLGKPIVGMPQTHIDALKKVDWP